MNKFNNNYVFTIFIIILSSIFGLCSMIIDAPKNNFAFFDNTYMGFPEDLTDWRGWIYHYLILASWTLGGVALIFLIFFVVLCVWCQGDLIICLPISIFCRCWVRKNVLTIFCSITLCLMFALIFIGVIVSFVVGFIANLTIGAGFIGFIVTIFTAVTSTVDKFINFAAPTVSLQNQVITPLKTKVNNFSDDINRGIYYPILNLAAMVNNSKSYLIDIDRLSLQISRNVSILQEQSQTLMHTTFPIAIPLVTVPTISVPVGAGTNASSVFDSVQTSIPNALNNIQTFLNQIPLILATIDSSYNTTFTPVMSMLSTLVGYAIPYINQYVNPVILALKIGFPILEFLRLFGLIPFYGLTIFILLLPFGCLLCCGFFPWCLKIWAFCCIILFAEIHLFFGGFLYIYFFVANDICIEIDKTIIKGEKLAKAQFGGTIDALIQKVPFSLPNSGNISLYGILTCPSGQNFLGAAGLNVSSMGSNMIDPMMNSILSQVTFNFSGSTGGISSTLKNLTVPNTLDLTDLNSKMANLTTQVNSISIFCTGQVNQGNLNLNGNLTSLNSLIASFNISLSYTRYNITFLDITVYPYTTLSADQKTNVTNGKNSVIVANSTLTLAETTQILANVFVLNMTNTINAMVSDILIANYYINYTAGLPAIGVSTIDQAVVAGNLLQSNVTSIQSWTTSALISWFNGQDILSCSIIGLTFDQLKLFFCKVTLIPVLVVGICSLVVSLIINALGFVMCCLGNTCSCRKMKFIPFKNTIKRIYKCKFCQNWRKKLRSKICCKKKKMVKPTKEIGNLSK